VATSGMAGVYRSDGASRGETEPGLFWRDMADIARFGVSEMRQDSAQCGTAGRDRIGEDRLGSTGCGAIGSGAVKAVRCDLATQAGIGMTRRGVDSER